MALLPFIYKTHLAFDCEITNIVRYMEMCSLLFFLDPVAWLIILLLHDTPLDELYQQSDQSIPMHKLRQYS